MAGVCGMANETSAFLLQALLAHGWDLAWIDGVTGEIQRRRLQAAVPQVEAAVSGDATSG
jgi:hypothetical protein